VLSAGGAGAAVFEMKSMVLISDLASLGGAPCITAYQLLYSRQPLRKLFATYHSFCNAAAAAAGALAGEAE
jgi:hypothetical protein